VRAALVSEIEKPPRVADRDPPRDADGRAVVEVVAAALNPIDVAVGSGRFYGGHPELPYVPGSEAVARDRESGDLVWIARDGLGVQRDGTFAELATASREAFVRVPDGADPALAAALGIAGVAGWLPVVRRAPVRDDDVVLVLGATGTVGSVALQAAKLLGARRVVAASRNAPKLRRAEELGADATVVLDAGEEASDTVLRSLPERLREACGGDGPTYVVDPLWGPVVAAAAEAAAPGARIVHIGQSAGAGATFASAVVRGKQLEILGYSNFAQTIDVLREEYPRLVRHSVDGAIVVDVERVALEHVADAWRRQTAGGAPKLVIVP
jgi:NADPH:quinone reductase